MWWAQPAVTLIGILVAIASATLVYRWQKNIDRETAVQVERRSLYARYMAACKHHFFSQPFVGDAAWQQKIDDFFSISPSEVEVYALRDQIYLIGSDSVIRELTVQERHFRDWKINFPKPGETDPTAIAKGRQASEALLAADHNLLRVMREELSNHSVIVNPAMIYPKIKRATSIVSSRVRGVAGALPSNKSAWAKRQPK